MLYKQLLAVCVCAALGAADCAAAARAPLMAAPDAGAGAPEAGFYGGVVFRQGLQERPGLRFGSLPSAWSKFVAPTADETASRSLLFGGYRWRNDMAFEAAFATADRYSLAPGGRGGVGLAVASPSAGVAPQSWNADVYTSWSFRKSLALYGRLGYAQTETALAYVPASFLSADPRRTRDGVNYGVGVRYDVTRTLGLRLEYARFGHFAGESVNGLLPESDQVQFGMQFRF